MTNIFDNMKVVPQPQVQKPQQPLTEPQTPVAVATSPVVEQVTIPAAPQTDTVEIAKPKKERKGPIKAVKGFIANVKKFFATVGEYAKGTAKGIYNGVVSGAVVYTGAKAIDGIRKIKLDKAAKIAKENGEEFTKTLKKLPAKPLAIVTAVGALAISLWNASLNATQKQSEIEHRWTGH